MTQFLKSRAGLVLIVFLAAGGFLLTFEHRAHILTSNGILFAFLAACIGIHLLMHRSHGGKSDPSHSNREESAADTTDSEEK